MSRIRVFSASHNSHKYCINCIESVAQQSLSPYEHFYVDDCSKDDTLVWLERHHKSVYESVGERYNLEIQIRKETRPGDRKYKLLNLYEYVSRCDGDDIICVLDGDDWLATTDVLEKVAEQYRDPSVRYVYTNWKYSHDDQLGISQAIPDNDWNPYGSPWITSAMSTFKASEFLKIPVLNFLRWDSKWFTMACDQAYVLPILWQLRESDGDYRAVRFIDEPLYVYQFLQNPNKQRHGEENIVRALDADRSSKFLRQRGYLK